MKTSVPFPQLRLQTIAVIVICLFAGCTEAPKSGNVAATVPSSPPSAIDGLVVDDLQNPVPGANVLLSEAGWQSITDKDGRFHFDGIASGHYSLQTTKPGYVARTLQVKLASGETARVAIFLEALPPTDPQQFTMLRKATISDVGYKLTPTCLFTGVHPALKTCGVIRGACQPAPSCEVHFSNANGCPREYCIDVLDRNPNWSTITVEAMWPSWNSTAGRTVTLELNAPNVTRAGTLIDQGDRRSFRSEPSAHPARIRVDNPTTLLERGIEPKDWCCDWFYRPYAGYCEIGSRVGSCDTVPDFGLNLETVITVYSTFHFATPAPINFTALPGGT